MGWGIRIFDDFLGGDEWGRGGRGKKKMGGGFGAMEFVLGIQYFLDKKGKR